MGVEREEAWDEAKYAACFVHSIMMMADETTNLPLMKTVLAVISLSWIWTYPHWVCVQKQHEVVKLAVI